MSTEARVPVDVGALGNDVVAVARALLGKLLLREGVGGPIVEVEAYRQDEPACHGHRGPTSRNASLFLPAGHLYVYRIHQSMCANVVTAPAGTASAVLIRALLPLHGRDRIARRRRGQPERAWTDGPGKLCQALGITLADDGRDLSSGPLELLDAGLRVPARQVLRGPRIGISRAVELPWRLVVAPAGQAALRARAAGVSG